MNGVRLFCNINIRVEQVCNFILKITLIWNSDSKLDLLPDIMGCNIDGMSRCYSVLRDTVDVIALKM